MFQYLNDVEHCPIFLSTFFPCPASDKSNPVYADRNQHIQKHEAQNYFEIKLQT